MNGYLQNHILHLNNKTPNSKRLKDFDLIIEDKL